MTALMLETPIKTKDKILNFTYKNIRFFTSYILLSKNKYFISSIHRALSDFNANRFAQTVISMVDNADGVMIMKKLWEMTLQEFKDAADKGRIHKVTGVELPEEQEAITPLKLGEINNYSQSDIARFYASRRGAYRPDLLKSFPDYDPYLQAYIELIEDALSEGRKVTVEILGEVEAGKQQLILA